MNKNLIEFLNGCTDEEKEEAFNKLDKELHNDDETREALAEQNEIKDNRIYQLEGQLEEATTIYEPEPEQFFDYIRK